MPFHQLQKFNQRGRRPGLASLVTGESNFTNTDYFRKFGLGKFKVLTDTPNLGAHITFYCSNNRCLRFGVTKITCFIPNSFATCRAEISFHRMQGQGLPTVGKSFILNFGNHF